MRLIAQTVIHEVFMHFDWPPDPCLVAGFSQQMGQAMLPCGLQYQLQQACTLLALQAYVDTES